MLHVIMNLCSYVELLLVIPTFFGCNLHVGLRCIGKCVTYMYVVWLHFNYKNRAIGKVTDGNRVCLKCKNNNLKMRTLIA